MGKSHLRNIVLISCLIFFLALAWTVQAQNPTPPTPREQLIKSIQARAQRDVELGNAALTVRDLDVLFGVTASTAGVPMTEVVETYEGAYQVAKNSLSIWDRIIKFGEPSLGWFAAVVMFILGALLVAARGFLTRTFNSFGELIYRQFAGYRPFWTIALRRYHKALTRNHSELKIPFRPNRPLKMRDVYVPLQIAGVANQDKVDALQAIRDFRQLVVLGTPGSGKTMFLRHMAFLFSQARWAKDQPVPVFLELNRLNSSSLTLFNQLVQVLEVNDFPDADRFLRAFLERGKLLILLDGLDEVSSQARERVVTQIKDLLKKYHDNRFVITCRTQIYHDEFSDISNRKVEVAEFSDHQIHRFLSAWEPEMPGGKSVEQLLRTLRERPQIMALARNPLMLTMIAYLYTDTPFVLPHSRAEFYEQSTGLLLDKWDQAKGGVNQYKSIQKQLVLQRLAFCNHNEQTSSDRRSIDFTRAISETRALLPSLTLEEKDAQPILEEIVERSGLLISIDGGARYQFSHLTLQEFFTAQYLRDDLQKLLGLFSASPTAWREVVRLWCGLAHESTDLIKTVYSTDPVLALECLADAQQVNATYAIELIEISKQRMLEEGENENLKRALALVAADPRPRGKELLRYLIDRLYERENQEIAAEVLVLTNLPIAADEIAKCAYSGADLHRYLEKMGDLSVPSLVAIANDGIIWAIEVLREIGTPLAAQVLVSMLWKRKYNLHYYSAWQLAALFQFPHIIEAIRSFKLDRKLKKGEYIDWVWAPFNEPLGSSVPVIAGRIAYLLSNAPFETIPSGQLKLDPRFVIPTCFIINRLHFLTNPLGFQKQIDGFSLPKTIGFNFFTPGKYEANIAHLMARSDADESWMFMFFGLPITKQKKIIEFVIPNFSVSQEDWKGINQPNEFWFEKSWLLHAFKFSLLILLILNLLSIATHLLNCTVFLTWQNGLSLLFCFALIFYVIWLLRHRYSNEDLRSLDIAEVQVVLSIFFFVWSIFSNHFLGLFLLGLYIALELFVLRTKILSLIQTIVFVLFTNIGFVLGVLLELNFLNAYARPLFPALGIIGGSVIAALILKKRMFGSLGSFFIVAGFSTISFLGMYFPTELLFRLWQCPAVMVFWVVVLLMLRLIVVLSKKHDRRASNILRAILNDEDVPIPLEFI